MTPTTALRPNQPDTTQNWVITFPSLFGGSALGWSGTSSYCGSTDPEADPFRENYVTAQPLVVDSVAHFNAAEVARLQSQILELVRLSRAEIALAIGVDRRSLSGFISGEIQPTPQRMNSLRFLADVVTYANRRWVDRTREILTWRFSERTALELVALGDPGVYAFIDNASQGSPPYSISQRQTTKAPTHTTVKAPNGGPVPRVGVRRAEQEYSQDLNDARFYEEATPSRRRPSVR